MFFKDKNGKIASARRISFQNCRFNMPGCRLITCCDTDISFQGGEYLDSYDVLVLGDKDRPNRVDNKKLRNGSRKQLSRN